MQRAKQITENEVWEVTLDAPHESISRKSEFMDSLFPLQFPRSYLGNKTETRKKEGGCFCTGKLDNGSSVTDKLSALAWWVTGRKRKERSQPVLRLPDPLKG